MGTLYRKVGKRYVTVGEDFTGFPSEGVWYVEPGMRSMRQIMKIGDLPDPRPLVELERHRLAATTALMQAMHATNRGMSVDELVTIVFKAVAAASQE